MAGGDQAANALKRRVGIWATRLKVSPGVVRVQWITWKWGSCSTVGTITLATDLYEQAPGFQDFVIRALLSLHLPNWRVFDAAR
jgi:predicted metal-dependent hydrolase